MKSFSFFIFSVWLYPMSYGQPTNSYLLDKSNPESVVKAIFHAAKFRDFKILEGLCDSLYIGNDDTKMICMLSDISVSKESTIYTYISESGSKYDDTPLDSVRNDSKEFLSILSLQFVKMFENGSIIDKTQYKTGTERLPNIPVALIPIRYHDTEGKIINSTVCLVKRADEWFIIGI